MRLAEVSTTDMIWSTKVSYLTQDSPKLGSLAELAEVSPNLLDSCLDSKCNICGVQTVDEYVLLHSGMHVCTNDRVTS